MNLLFIGIILFEHRRPVRERLSVKLEFEITIVPVLKACVLTVKRRSEDTEHHIVRTTPGIFIVTRS